LIVVLLPLVMLVLTQAIVTIKVPGVIAVRPPSIAGLALVTSGTTGGGWVWGSSVTQRRPDAPARAPLTRVPQRTRERGRAPDVPQCAARSASAERPPKRPPRRCSPRPRVPLGREARSPHSRETLGRDPLSPTPAIRT